MGVVIERAGLQLADPDADQVARQVMPLGERMKRLTGDELLRDLTFELDTVRAVTCLGFHPVKAQPSRSIQRISLSTPRGALQLGVNTWRRFTARCTFAEHHSGFLLGRHGLALPNRAGLRTRRLQSDIKRNHLIAASTNGQSRIGDGFLQLPTRGRPPS